MEHHTWQQKIQASRRIRKRDQAQRSLQSGMVLATATKVKKCESFSLFILRWARQRDKDQEENGQVEQRSGGQASFVIKIGIIRKETFFQPFFVTDLFVQGQQLETALGMPTRMKSTCLGGYCVRSREGDGWHFPLYFHLRIDSLFPKGSSF
uniref:Antifreeze protein n=1 Tax=Populus suaveolens TaxID=245546 RepID=Q6UAH5_9ROSI|nr:antifreeze protein [Populus suaveolens]